MSVDYSSIAGSTGCSTCPAPTTSSGEGDSGPTIQRMILCDRAITLAGLKIPALLVSIVGGLLIGILINYLFTKMFGTLSTEVEFFVGLLRIGGILLVSYILQKFFSIRNMYPGLWPSGLKPTQTDPTAQAVNQVLCKLGGIKQAAKKLGGLSNLADSVGGLPVLIKASGGLSGLISEYGTFEDFVCNIGGAAKLQEQLPNSNDLYLAMGGSSCSNKVSMPMDDDS